MITYCTRSLPIYMCYIRLPFWFLWLTICKAHYLYFVEVGSIFCMTSNKCLVCVGLLQPLQKVTYSSISGCHNTILQNLSKTPKTSARDTDFKFIENFSCSSFQWKRYKLLLNLHLLYFHASYEALVCFFDAFGEL